MSKPNRTVLVVDDDLDMCWVLEYMLEKLNLQCIRALDGQSALRVVESNVLSLVLLDAKLSDMDGLELARQIHVGYPSVPILLVSGYFYRDDPAVQSALDQGLILGFIEKPFSHVEIRGALDAALENGSSTSKADDPPTAAR